MKTFSTLAILLLGLSLSLVPTIASAQFNDDFGNCGGNSDPLSQASAGDSTCLFQLLNKAQLRGKNNPSDSNEQRKQLNSATEDFRTRQLKFLHKDAQKDGLNKTIQPELSH